MSTEEDTELRDLLQQTLENNGSLAKIRAQLRACVFMAFDENEKIQSQQPLMNKKIKAQLEQPEGQLLFGLVHEFLQYYDMDYTLSVYKSEAYLDNTFPYSERTKLVKELQLDVNESVPVLMQLLKKTLSNIVPKSNGLDEHFNKSIEDEIPKVPFLNQTFDIPNNDSKNNTPRSVTSEGKDDTYEGTSSIAEDSIKEKTISTEANEEFIEHTDKSNSSVNSAPMKLDILDKFMEKNEKPPIKPDKYRNKSPRSSLPDINSPMQANKSRDFVLPSLYNSNSGYDDNLDNYEEDFMSTSDADLKSEQSHSALNHINLNKTPIKVTEKSVLNEEKDTSMQNVTNDSFASSVTSEDFELNSTVDDILKSNSN